MISILLERRAILFSSPFSLFLSLFPQAARSVVNAEAQTPPTPARKNRVNEWNVCKCRSAEPRLAWTHLRHLVTPPPRRSAEPFRAAPRRSVGWTSCCGLCFRLGRVGGNPFAVGIIACAVILPNSGGAMQTLHGTNGHQTPRKGIQRVSEQSAYPMPHAQPVLAPCLTRSRPMLEPCLARAWKIGKENSRTLGLELKRIDA